MTSIVARWYDDGECWVLDRCVPVDPSDHRPDFGHFVVEARDSLWTIYTAAREMMDLAYAAIVAEAGLASDIGALVAACDRHDPDPEHLARAHELMSPGLIRFIQCRTCGRSESDHLDTRRCRSCRCTEFNPCCDLAAGAVPCHWVAPDLCSACA